MKTAMSELVSGAERTIAIQAPCQGSILRCPSPSVSHHCAAVTNISRTLGRTRDMANENEQNEYSCDMYRQCHLGNGASHKTHASPVTGGTYHKMHVSPATNGMLQLDILICPVSTTVQWKSSLRPYLFWLDGKGLSWLWTSAATTVLSNRAMLLTWLTSRRTVCNSLMVLLPLSADCNRHVFVRGQSKGL